MAYIGKGLDNGVRNQFIFAATQGQTAFTGADSDGKTLAMTDILYVDCYQNGVKLEPTTDYTVTLTTLTLVVAASLSDVVDIVSFDTFGVPDTVPASTGGTFSGGISATTFSGSVTSGTTSTFTSTQAATNADILKLNATQTNSSSNLKFQINGGSTAQAQIRLGGNNDVSFHTTSSDTERLRLLSAGGITFNGDTAAANALDDYEEGTFTPTLYGSSTAGSPNYSARLGYYTKVGNVVNCTIWLVTSALGGLDGSVKIGALPFSTNGSSDARSTITCGYGAGLALTAGNTLSGWIEANVTYINLTNWDNAVGTTDLDDAEWSDNGAAMISFAYRT